MKSSVTVDVTTPIATAASTNSIGMGMGALSGLGGYMTLGLGAKAKPNVININENEALISKDSEWLDVVAHDAMLSTARQWLPGWARGQDDKVRVHRLASTS